VQIIESDKQTGTSVFPVEHALVQRGSTYEDLSQACVRAQDVIYIDVKTDLKLELLKCTTNCNLQLHVASCREIVTCTNSRSVCNET
jgi:hypothetical protein